MALRKRQEKDSVNSNESFDETMKYRKTNLKGDWNNIILLFCLYTLQGIPLGLAGAIPMILQNRGVSYKQQVSKSSKLQ